LLKCEHQQKTGSFKVRGALAKLLSLSAAQRERGVVAASSGNHGLGVAYALSVLGGTGFICVPEHASPLRSPPSAAMAWRCAFWAARPLRPSGLARLLTAEREMSYIGPYKDLDVIAGQGTIGEEIVRQLEGRPVDEAIASAASS
jgi:threonine dehydratase